MQQRVILISSMHNIVNYCMQCNETVSSYIYCSATAYVIGFLFNAQRKELVLVCNAAQQAPVICYLFPAKRIKLLQCNARVMSALHNG